MLGNFESVCGGPGKTQREDVVYVENQGGLGEGCRELVEVREQQWGYEIEATSESPVAESENFGREGLVKISFSGLSTSASDR